MLTFELLMIELFRTFFVFDQIEASFKKHKK